MLLVISSGGNDWDELLRLSGIPYRRCQPGYLQREDLALAEAVAILGPWAGEPTLLEPAERLLLEQELAKGKRIFAEYCLSIGNVYTDVPASNRRLRLLAMPAASGISGLEPGAILDDWDGQWLAPWFAFGEPLLVYATVAGHDRALNMPRPEDVPRRQWALWFEPPGNLLLATFRLSAAVSGRYGPREHWQALTRWVLSWLLGREVQLRWPRGAVWHAQSRGDAGGRRARAAAAADRAIEWYSRSGVLLDEGRRGVLEGFGTEIRPDGSQPLRPYIRADCCGEVALAFLAHYRLSGEPRSLAVARNLVHFRAEYLQCHEPGPLYGMGRWSNAGWNVCYQDDVARAIIPQMLLATSEEDERMLANAVDALEFLVRTTGPDGTRVSRTDSWRLTPAELERLRMQPARFPSAHYNGYYWAALVLAYQATGREDFLDVAWRGLRYTMSCYPETVREMSETEENCRLVLPLSWLALATADAQVKGWLEEQQPPMVGWCLGARLRCAPPRDLRLLGRCRVGALGYRDRLDCSQHCCRAGHVRERRVALASRVPIAACGSCCPGCFPRRGVATSQPSL